MGGKISLREHLQTKQTVKGEDTFSYLVNSMRWRARPDSNWRPSA
jgi:hypothetical protein